MGRKAVDKERKSISEKQLKWVEQLYPKLNEVGLKGLTMNSIAQMMGKSKSTVYEYFKSKEELVEATIQFKLSQLAGFEALLNSSDIEFSKKYLHVMEHVGAVFSDISTGLLNDIKEYFPALWIRIEEFIDFATGVLENHYREGIENGLYNDIEPSILVLSDRLFFQAISDPTFLQRQGLTIQDAFDQYLKLKFHGMLK
ncbi:MAG: TetR/AcrR family transcriptional regulator [Flavobacteriales bacterium]|nr:TetR/AcrR family transcriptional regulator [Flavobacteriales bacterium]